MTVETTGIPAQPGDSAPAAATADTAPSSSISIKVTLDGHGAAAGSRWRCERFDGTPAHLAMTLDTPLTDASLAKMAKLKCWCGTGVALVLREG